MKYARKSPWALLYKFHRYTGLIIAIIILMLAVTGIILNHTDDLQLDEQFVESDLLLNWYGIDAPKIKHAYAILGKSISQVDKQIYLDTKPIYKSDAPLVGAAINDSFIVAAFSNALLMLSHEGETIEAIAKESIQNIASDANGDIYIKRAGKIYFSDDALLSWNPSDQKITRWATSVSLPEELRQQLKQHGRQNILPYERVLLDIHSGRFFGAFGVYVIDFSGLLLILLTVSGCWIWLRHRLKTHRKPNRK